MQQHVESCGTRSRGAAGSTTYVDRHAEVLREEGHAQAAGEGACRPRLVAERARHVALSAVMHTHAQLRVSHAQHASIVDVGASDEGHTIIHDHELRMNVHLPHSHRVRVIIIEGQRSVVAVTHLFRDMVACRS